MSKGRRLKSLEVRRAVNGVTVRHETEPIKRKASKGGGPYPSDPYEPAQEHAFNDRNAAMAHVTKHLGQMFGVDDEADEGQPDENAPDAQDVAGRRDDVAAFHRLRKKGHLG